MLENCSLEIRAGESVAIIGPSGQGKSTLVKLLLGLLKPAVGTIEVNGMDIRKLGMSWYRDHIGSVMQDDILFAGSLSDNISFFSDTHCDQQRVERAASLAQIHDDIVGMSMGYNSLVGEMASSLSGGQMQRVLLARALYRYSDILILDEATSHLDITRESAINSAIKDMKTTRIIIAHRPETIRSADRIILLSHDGIREVSHEQFASS